MHTLPRSRVARRNRTVCIERGVHLDDVCRLCRNRSPLFPPPRRRERPSPVSPGLMGATPGIPRTGAQRSSGGLRHSRARGVTVSKRSPPRRAADSYRAAVGSRAGLLPCRTNPFRDSLYSPLRATTRERRESRRLAACFTYSHLSITPSSAEARALSSEPELERRRGRRPPPPPPP
mmetsp:Transcript_19594/g.61606  ORF Transcript_19594/g.61606 Transcript_19594/m.61606 type:complete len:177 (+) Transcript_19594:59-589(+)